MGSDLRKIWDIFTPPERRRAIWMLLLVVLMALAETAGVLSIMPFLSTLGRPEIVIEQGWLQAAYRASGLRDAHSFTIALGVASIAFVVASSAFKILVQHALNRFIHMQRHSISVRLLGKYLRQPYAFFLSRNSADLNKNILSETDQLSASMMQPLAQMLAQGAVVLAMTILIVVYDPWMAACIVVVVGGLYALIYGLVRKRLVRIGTERLAANRERYQASNEALGGIKDVKVTHAAKAYTQRFRHASHLYSRHMAANDTLSQTPLYLVEAVGYTGLILIALALLLRSEGIAHVLPALGLYGFAAYRMLPAAQIMYRGFAKLRFSSPALDAIHRDLTLPEEQTRPADSALEPHTEIRLQGVSYAYPAAPNAPVLNDFDLTIPAHTCIGIVGESGAGKSTLIDLLLGLLYPQAGTLSVDGIPITADNIGAWQRAIGYVPQHIYLADTSVAENIAFGIARDSIDMQAVERAARAAQIHDYIVNGLPDGYETKIGDRGTRLSGGQRQRVGIARALYRDPPVLFLDEATSALDPQTESALNEAISHMSGEKTILIVSHNQAGLRNCRDVVTLAHGAQPTNLQK